MKKIGLIGGAYYKTVGKYANGINEGVNQIFRDRMPKDVAESIGEAVSADLRIADINYYEYSQLIEQGDWRTVGDKLVCLANELSSMGCDYVAIADNTLHEVADRVEEALAYIGDSEFVHVADCIAAKCYEEDIYSVAIIGTKNIMKGGSIRERMEGYGLRAVSILTKEEIDTIDEKITKELHHGHIVNVGEYIQKACLKIAKTREVDAIIMCCNGLYDTYSRDFIRDLAKYNVKLIEAKQAHVDKLVGLASSDN